MHERPPAAGPAAAYLEHYPEPGKAAHRIELRPLPFRIGRSKTAHWVIYSPRVSKEHAEILWDGDELRVRDLGSTNGTFVNGHRIADSPLADGDILHVAHEEFRFGCESDGSAHDPAPLLMTDPVTGQLPASLIRGSEHLQELLARPWVFTLFQPIVDLATRVPMGYEALGRGSHCKLSPNPIDLFNLASQWRLAADLSRTFRRAALEQVAQLGGGIRVFLNVHPTEMQDPGLLDHLGELRSFFRADQHMVVEVHEDAVPDLAALARLCTRLRGLGIGIAFDDFGAGRDRHLEVAEAPPDFVKLDRRLVRRIDVAESRQEVVRSLCNVIRKFGVQLIAEGVETAEEARVCQAFGCHFGQGYFFGRPQRLNDLGKR